MALWYFETVSPMGRWSPCTAPDRPATVSMGGHLRERRSGGIGPRIRHIAPVPEAYHHLSPAQLREVIAPDGLFTAVARPLEAHDVAAE